jgi:hypothetical protein
MRSRFTEVGGSPYQRVEESSGYDWSLVDLSALDRGSADSQVISLTAAFLREKFDLAVSASMAARMFRVSANEHVLVLGFDHLVSDMMSNSILQREIWSLYFQGARGLPFALPELRLQFPDYALWLHRTHEDWMRKHERYWKERLVGAPTPRLPIDDRIADLKAPTLEAVVVPFGVDLTNRLRDIARRQGVSLPLVACAIYAVAMSHWCDQKKLLVKFVSHGRFRTELVGMVGFLAHSLNLSFEITWRDRFIDFLKAADLQLKLAYEHRDCDRMSHVIPELAPQVHHLHFNWLPSIQPGNWGGSNETGHAALELKSFRLPDQFHIMPYSLWTLFGESPAGIVATVFYLGNAFSGETIKRLEDDLRTFADALASRPFDRMAPAPVSSRPADVNGMS